MRCVERQNPLLVEVEYELVEVPVAGELKGLGIIIRESTGFTNCGYPRINSRSIGM